MICLDSADLDDARRAAGLGYVEGVTTNPKLMAGTGRKPLDQLAMLLEALPSGPVFYQPASGDAEAAEDEVRTALSIDPERVIPKLAATGPMFALGSRLAAEQSRFAVTAVYSPAQALLSARTGAEWIIPYVDRAARLRPESRLIPELAAVLAAIEAGTGILAASIKSPGQAVQALVDGARGITAPLEVLEALAEDPLSEQALQEFSEAAEGLHG